MRDARSRHYSQETYERVEKVFYDLAAEYDPVGKVIMPRDVRARANISQDTWRWISKDAPWWDDIRQREMYKNNTSGVRKAILTEYINGREGHSETSALTIRSNNYRNRIIDVLRASPGIPSCEVAKYMKVEASRIYYHVHALRVQGIIDNHNYIVSGDEQEDRQEYTKVNSLTIKGNRRRQQIVEHLKLFPCSNANQIAKRIGINHKAVSKHLHILRSQGIIDERNCLEGQEYTKPKQIQTRCQGDITRQRIIEDIRSFPGSRLRQIASRVGISYQGVQQHLRILRDQGIIDEHKTTHGKIVEYLRLFPGSSGYQIANGIRMSPRYINRRIQDLKKQGIIDEHNRPVQQDSA